MHLTGSTAYWIAVSVVVVLSSARLTRLATYDKFPPVVWIRDRFATWTDHNDRSRQWQLLAFCGYCASFWLTLLVVICGDLAGVLDGKPWHSWMTPAWWVFNGTLGASYLAAVFMALDQDNPED